MDLGQNDLWSSMPLGNVGATIYADELKWDENEEPKRYVIDPILDQSYPPLWCMNCKINYELHNSERGYFYNEDIKRILCMDCAYIIRNLKVIY